MRVTRQGGARQAVVASAACWPSLSGFPRGGDRPTTTSPSWIRIEDELRVLDYYDPGALHNPDPAPASRNGPHSVHRATGIGPPPALDRVREMLAGAGRAGAHPGPYPLFAPDPRYNSTPRLFESSSEKTRFEVSAGAERVGENQGSESHLLSGSGFHGRLALVSIAARLSALHRGPHRHAGGSAKR